MQEYTQQGMQSNCMQIANKATQATIAYVNQRVAETIKKIGPVPTKFSVFTMGSMARDESGFFTDLEIGILVAKKDPTVLDYFKRFSQVLQIDFSSWVSIQMLAVKVYVLMRQTMHQII